MSNQLRALICELANEFDAEDNTSFNLWTYLPSYKEAKRHHGDYASAQQPKISDLMYETNLYIIHITRKLADENFELTEEEKSWYSCPCGEDHYEDQ